MGWPLTRIRPHGRGYLLTIPAEELAVLRTLPTQMRELLNTDDPALERLFPPAYVGDPELESEYRDLMRDDLMAKRTSSIDVMEATLDRKQLTEEELTGWMGALNDLRLVLGTRLDVSENDHDMLPEDDPRGPGMALYHYLTMLQSEAIEALSVGLPDDGIDDTIKR
ncbi:MAG: DUF2017 family protein [Acidimicrobiales bacterium]